MAEERAQRHLAAILAADVVGYSRLMGRDEAGTLATLKALRAEVFEPRTRAHGGRIFKIAGDGALCEFTSAVDAVRAALDVQGALAERNAGLPEDRRIALRIGIALGDVIAEGGDLYGHGVNLAARIEGLAEPGSVCVAANVAEHLQTAGGFAVADIGEHQLKNIERPIRVFRVAGAGARETSAPRPALALPDKPSIAVLPFQNMSGDPEQEYFADGVVEDIITALSHFPRLFVIARNSSFTYKGRPGIDIRQIGRELGVRYVLEGSVRKAGERVRITGQLIDATSGTHLWADRFDSILADIFDLQDNVARSVVGAIEPRLMSAEIERAQRKRTVSLEAYDLYLRALPNVYVLTREGSDAAIALLAQALAIDPDYAVAAGLAGWCYVARMAQGWDSDWDTARRAGTNLGRRAIAKGPNDPEALALGGFVLSFFEVDKRAGLAAIERATTLNPNSAQGWTHAGVAHMYIGEAVSAVAMFERAIRQSPRDPLMFQTYAGLSWAHLLQERFDEAVLWGRRAVAENPNYMSALRSLAAALGHLGRLDEARGCIESLRALGFAETLTSYSKTAPWPSERLPMILHGLRKAGLPE